jgi:hypothetical protein
VLETEHLPTYSWTEARKQAEDARFLAESVQAVQHRSLRSVSFVDL